MLPVPTPTFLQIRGTTHTHTHTHTYDMDTNLYLAQTGCFQFMSYQEIYNIRLILLMLRLIIKFIWCLSDLTLQKYTLVLVINQ